MTNPEAIRYSSLEPIDFELLKAMAREVFADTFAHLFEKRAFINFLEQTFGVGGRMQRDFMDPSIQWRLAKEGVDVVGYAKLRPLVAPAPSPLPNALELQQIYVTDRWKGRGVASALMDWAIASAVRAGTAELYLTVFDHNERAKRFYARYGFSEVGRCEFTLGGKIYDDRVWRKSIR